MIESHEEIDKLIGQFYDRYSSYLDVRWEDAYSKTMDTMIETDTLYSYPPQIFIKYIQRLTKNNYLDIVKVDKNRMRILRDNAEFLLDVKE